MRSFHQALSVGSIPVHGVAAKRASRGYVKQQSGTAPNHARAIRIAALFVVPAAFWTAVIGLML